MQNTTDTRCRPGEDDLIFTCQLLSGVRAALVLGRRTIYARAVRVLILSDIHANRPALDAVLEHAYANTPRYGAVYSLGDALGYGPHPREVLEELQRIGAECVMGNHDLHLLQLAGGQQAPASGTGSQMLAWQLSRLSERDLRYVRSWKDVLDVPELEARFRHGSPLSISEYTDAEAARRSFAQWPGALAFVGHTHVPAAFAALRGAEGDLVRQQALSAPPQRPYALYRIPPRARVILNPGSVGQPRDGDPRAAYAVYDSAARTFQVERVPYDIQQTQCDLRGAGLPQSLRTRLEEGR